MAAETEGGNGELAGSPGLQLSRELWLIVRSLVEWLDGLFRELVVHRVGQVRTEGQGLMSHVLGRFWVRMLWTYGSSNQGFRRFQPSVMAAVPPPDLPTAEGRAEAIKLLDPDFQGLLKRKGFSDRLQGTLSNAEVTSISLFAVIGDMSGPLVDHCGLDRGQDVVSVAGLIDAWQGMQ